MPSLSGIVHKINHSTYKLDLSGVVGLFGGDNAVDALETIHLYAGRRWAGWYNYPGTVTVARRFGQMADSRLWDSIFPGPNESPAVTFNLAGKSGPEYGGAISGTKLCTGYLGYLTAEECTDSPSKPLRLFKEDGSDGRKTGSSAAVTVISLPPHQRERIAWCRTDTNVTRQKPELIPIIPKYDPPLAFTAIIPSVVSILACTLCFIAKDFLCASLILFGTICSGLSSLVLGTATLHIRVPVPSQASPAGDGLLFPADGSIIILKGEEADVNIVTKGEFELDFSTGILPSKKHHMVGITSLLLMSQFLGQLLLIPLSTFFGQILFLISFIASGVYHLYVVSHEREIAHRGLLSQVHSARMEKWILGTRTQMAVFVCLVLGDGHQYPVKTNPDAVLVRIIPNETPVWKYWRRKVSKELQCFWSRDPASCSYVPSIQAEPDDEIDKVEYSPFTEEEVMLLKELICDAWCVFNRYQQWRESESGVWQDRSDNVEKNVEVSLLPGGSLA